MTKIVCLILAFIISLSCCAIVTAETAETAPVSDSSANDSSVLTWLSGLWENAEDFTESKWDTISSRLKTLWEKIVDYFGDASSSLSDMFGIARGSIAELLTGISDYVRSLTGQIIDLFD